MEKRLQFSLGYLFLTVSVWAVAFALTRPAMAWLSAPYSNLLWLLSLPFASLTAATYVVAIGLSLPLSSAALWQWLDFAAAVFKLGWAIALMLLIGILLGWP